ncbi:alpha/beta hydrolase [Phytohabitans flavus]|uniref:Alpha/beta hydrolase n=2 Tax=Phytohabitans flavus TaxID=1076124 RepID=A0A6F8XZ82_9ACTN|nr:alpha/beta hydrolase [Phytohabitans flavus]
MTLPDGRTLAFTDLGAPDGAPVFYFHGAPTSRLDLVPWDNELARMGLRVFSPDRPGYGRSTPLPGRDLEDWPADVAALAGYLGLARFAVVGYSTGGPYALVSAALLPGRVAAAGVVAGVTDMGWAPAWEGVEKREAELMRVGDEGAAVSWCETRYGADGARFSGGSGPWADADLVLMDNIEVAASLAETVGESFRQGVSGYAQDVTVQARPWTFDPGAVRVPVVVLHGEADTVIPTVHSRHTADLVPGAKLDLRPADGHLSIVARIPRLALDLVG